MWYADIETSIDQHNKKQTNNKKISKKASEARSSGERAGAAAAAGACDYMRLKRRHSDTNSSGS
jgi:hypothetical protein